MAHVRQHAAVANDTMSPGTIDGAKNPELIPDATAYRLFFVVVGLRPDPTPEDTLRQNAHLTKLALKNGDSKILVDALATFKSEYDGLIEKYNDSARSALLQGMPPDYDAFILQRDALVQSTRDGIKETLSADGLSNLDAVVQSEKRQMKMLHTAAK